MESAAPFPEPSAAAPVRDVPVVRPDRIPARRPLFVVGFLAWLVPGLGQVVMGRWRKALFMAVPILGLYAGGLALTGFTCVNPSEYGLEFVAHVLAGGPTLLTLHLTEGIERTAFLPHLEVGRLYVAVAGLLNVVAVSDALGDALAHNAEVDLERTVRAEAAADAARDAVAWGGESPLEADDVPATEPDPLERPDEGAFWTGTGGDE